MWCRCWKHRELTIHEFRRHEMVFVMITCNVRIYVDPVKIKLHVKIITTRDCLFKTLTFAL